MNRRTDLGSGTSVKAITQGGPRDRVIYYQVWLDGRAIAGISKSGKCLNDYTLPFDRGYPEFCYESLTELRALISNIRKTIDDQNEKGRKKMAKMKEYQATCPQNCASEVNDWTCEICRQVRYIGPNCGHVAQPTAVAASKYGEQLTCSDCETRLDADTD